VAQIGKGQPKRKASGKFTSSRSEKGEKIAKRLVNDPDYRVALALRLKQGVAGPIEVHLWRLAYGEPPKNDSIRDEEMKRFQDMREHLFTFLQDSPLEARALSVAVSRRPHPLALPASVVPAQAVAVPEPAPEPEEPPEPNRWPDPPPPVRRCDGR
jgi:hypothetical protein